MAAPDTLIFKIVPEPLWRAAEAAGRFDGSPVDIADGYIHFSTADQAEETARRHFHGQTSLLLAAFKVSSFGGDLRFEPSRGGDLFPHLYAALDPGTALWVRPLAWNGTQHIFPEGWNS
jgi:uncharacterized protein (DUF952 family)